jgi:hypothetical protein
MIRIIAILMVCTLAFSCTNEETKTPLTVEEPTNNSTPTEEEAIENPTTAKEPVENQAPPKVQEEKSTTSADTPTKAQKAPSSTRSSGIVAVDYVKTNTVFMTEAELAKFNSKPSKSVVAKKEELLSSSEIAALREMFDDFLDGVNGFARRDEDTTIETKIKTGAFDEIISATKSGEDITEDVLYSSNNQFDKKSLEYIRRPKPLVEYSGYKIELITVYNKSLELNDKLFQTFGGVTFKNNTVNSTTYYIGDFADTDALEDYLQKVVKERFPKARGVKFENGVEVKYK